MSEQCDSRAACSEHHPIELKTVVSSSEKYAVVGGLCRGGYSDVVLVREVSDGSFAAMKVGW